MLVALQYKPEEVRCVQGFKRQVPGFVADKQLRLGVDAQALVQPSLLVRPAQVGDQLLHEVCALAKGGRSVVSTCLPSQACVGE